jgi:signal transduction histidine kinase
MSEVLLDETDRAKMKEYINDIIQYTNHIATVVRELVTYARPASKDAEVYVDLRDRLREAVKMIHRSPSVAPTEVVSQFDAIPLIRARRSEIDQIFVNVVSNAVQAMGGRGRLTVSTAMAGDMIRVRIVDTGPGIPKALINKIFDPFFTTKGPGKGTGLGLSIVQKLMNKYCGLIRIDSEEGFGTTVTLEFPFMRTGRHLDNVAEVEKLDAQMPQRP